MTREVLGAKIDAIKTDLKDEMRHILSGFHERRKEIAERLGYSGPGDTKDHHRMPDQRFQTSGDWILQDLVFLKWLDPMDSASKTLYLNGMPGAGKLAHLFHVLFRQKVSKLRLRGPQVSRGATARE